MSWENIPSSSSTAKRIATVATTGDLPSGVPEGSIRYVEADDTLYTYDGAAWHAVAGGSGSGDVVGPASSTDNAIVRFDGTTGKLIQNSAVTIADTSGNIAGAGTISSGEITSSSLTASRALVSGSSKEIQASAVTSTELGYVSGVTSAIQTQIDGKEPTITTLAVNKGGTGQTTYTDGQLLIGNTSTSGLTKATLTAGSNISITNGNGSITIASSGGGTPGGSDTQVQFNDGGSFGGDAGFTYNKTTDTATLGSLSLTNPLAVGSGGTNSATALNNNRVMQSSGGSIVEAAAITASRALVSDSNGIPIAATTTATEIGYVNGVTSSIQTQLGNKQPLDATLTALAAYNTNGLVTQTAADTFTGRTLTGGGGITVTNGDGVSGNPTLSINDLKTLWLPSTAMRPSSSGGCAPISIVPTSSGQPDIATLDFDPTTTEYAQFAVRFPKGWNNSTVTAAFYWTHGSTTTNFGVVWGLQAVAVSDNEAIGANFGTAQEVTDTGGTTNNQYISPTTSAITIAGSPATADQVFFRLYRNATSGSDTLAIDACLLGIALFYTITTLDDA